MANRSRELNKNTNIFINKNSNQSNHRIITGKSLKELSDENENNNFKSKSENSNYRSKNRYNDRKTFSKPIIPKKEEFKVKENEFPELVQKKKQETDEIESCNYKEKVQKIKEKKEMEFKKVLKKGWIQLPISKSKEINKTDSNEISPYYNPKMAVKILENRLAEREELNDILGDISPYWNMVYPEELDDYDYDDTSDNYEEEEEEYVEDW
jgi:hypothetical protein